ncbi:SDR family NAD(P)-dependent oxidoreductase, partial [Streptomyces sp. McG2]
MRHVLVTGAAGGIGRAIATRFAAQGATLTLADRERAPLDDLAAHLPT